MRQRLLRLFRRGRFARRLAWLSGGTLLGHLILLITMPLLTRLFTPEEFGLFGVLMALNGIFVLLDWGTGGSGSGINWSQWVALIWGVFLGWEFISNFVAPHLWGRDMEERLIQREMRRRRDG